ncbi:hypothetical protein IMG5_100220 [Ichthyophthirius multifiliis]|uniref:Uncharacterized protein n=1 Tax=Ichthyophthirius multifiliis TaxID=5932 RepID=G0QSC6_ICHMU|nr:hypothetical protein IMG5_100220 [Ichthyophthirius multifiliis]EGR31873.1 hypothetical protein IMG5_100220 [Ichthyophthirius multifiliis]|eukprot:XP_004035359.1 hypothetical protein IMG5_100220 [Ichthyophthirius multifiliis]
MTDFRWGIIEKMIPKNTLSKISYEVEEDDLKYDLIKEIDQYDLQLKYGGLARDATKFWDIIYSEEDENQQENDQQLKLEEELFLEEDFTTENSNWKEIQMNLVLSINKGQSNMMGQEMDNLEEEVEKIVLNIQEELMDIFSNKQL